MKPFYLHPIAVNAYGGLKEELDAVSGLLDSHHYGSNMLLIPEGSLVIPRYRMIPFGRELEEELESIGSYIINSYYQHRQIADLSAWVYLLGDLTPPAYRVDEIPYLPEGEWFVKGETNSKKNDWFQSCYAPRTGDLIDLVQRNSSDSVLGSQTLYIRPYQKYRQVGVAVDGRPIFNERRVFIYEGQVVSVGAYWSSYPEALNVVAQDEQSFQETLAEAIARTKELASFYVIDLAEYEDGHWGVVELNDGVMSGLSENDPNVLWGAVFDLIQGTERATMLK